MARTAHLEDTPERVLPVLTSAIRHRWTASVFGIVAEGSVRRRPSDVARLVTSVVVVGLTAAAAREGTVIEAGVLSFLASLPGSLGSLFSFVYGLGVCVAAALVVTALAARRPRLLLTLLVAGAVSWLVAIGLDHLVDLPDRLARAGAQIHGLDPDFPLVPLATMAAVLLSARPYLTRPARRLLGAVFWLAATSALCLAAGLPTGVIASLLVGWGAAALAHLSFGTPAATPSAHQVAHSLRDLGVNPDGLVLADHQYWGRTRYRAGGDGELSVDVVGRDAADARLLAKLWRFVWYKDSGPTLSLTREGQVEHEAYVLLLAQRSGAHIPDVVAAGVAGDRDDAVLVVRDPAGVPLTAAGAGAITDAVLDDGWANLGRLHEARIAHGNATAGNTVLTDDGATALVELTGAMTSAGEDRTRLDRVQFLATTADLVGDDRALAAAERALGTTALTALLPLLQPAALTPAARHELTDPKAALASLGEAGAARTGIDLPKPEPLRRFSLGSVVLAGAFALGIYLLVGELVGVAEMGDIFRGAIWGWVAVAFVLAQSQRFSGAVALTGAVATPLPLGPVVGVEFARAFTGLVGGTAGNVALSVRFFEKRGLPVAVAVSSGVLDSLGGFAVQMVLVVVGLAATGSDFTFGGTSSSGGNSSDGTSVPGWLLALAAAIAIAAVGALVVPRVRRRIRDAVHAQLHDATANLRGILSTPRNAVKLFGGNLVTQILSAMVLGAALHAYGESLPLLQLVVINSFASLVGGLAPIPGGMGVVEAGLIAGFTAAGIPQAEAVAATFTARMCGSYLPPIWGWFSLSWLRHHDYV